MPNERLRNLNITLLLSMLQLLLGLATPQRTWATPEETLLEPRVRAFVGARYPYGIPPDSARALGHASTPILLRLLHSEPRANWTNIVTALSIIGSYGTFDELKALIWTRFNGRIDDATLQGIAAAIATMGAIPRDHAPGLTSYLCAAGNPMFWEKLPWTCRFPSVERNRWLSKLALSSLAWTGSAEADTCFMDRLNSAEVTADTLSICEFRDRNRKVKELGLLPYSRLMRSLTIKDREKGSR
jgi:hypothetical protein